MILAKTLLSILISDVVFLSYLLSLKHLLHLKFSNNLMYILSVGSVIIILLVILLYFYINKFLAYDIKRMEQKEIINISRIINFLPFLFSLLFILMIFAVGAYEFRLTKDINQFIKITSAALPLSFLTYYLTKFPLYEFKIKGFGLFENKDFKSILFKFSIVLIIHSLYISAISILPLILKSFLTSILFTYITVFSFLLFSFLFLIDIILRTRYILNTLRGGELETKIPILSNDELDLISVYVDGYIERNESKINFPYVFLGNKKIYLNYGKGNYGCIWVKIGDTKSMFDKLSEKILEEIQEIYSKIESISIKNNGLIYKFDGTECFIILGLDQKDWSESLISIVQSLNKLIYEEIYDKISTFKVGISSGGIFVGWVNGVKGNEFYFFGEALTESSIIGKYPKEEGFFISGEIKDLFEKTKFVDKVKVKDLEKIVEIYKLLI
ncbi:MAG: hypothetical protein ACP5PT_03930 [Brevinematia bacterium]